MRARSKSKNRRNLEVLLTTKKSGGDAIFSVGSSLNVVITGNVVEPKSGPNSSRLPIHVLCNGHDDTFTLVNSLDVVVAGNVMVDPKRYPNAICVPSTVPMHNSFDHTKNAVYKPKTHAKRAKYSRTGESRSRETAHHRSKFVSFLNIRVKLGSASGAAEGCNDANTVQMSNYYPGSSGSFKKKSAYKHNALIKMPKSTRTSEIQSRETNHRRSKVVTFKEIRAELDSAGGEGECCREANKEHKHSKNENSERLDESYFKRICARVSETAMPSALSDDLRVSDTTPVISNRALSQHSSSDASTPVVSNRTNSRACSQCSGSDAMMPVVSNRTTSRSEGLHGSVRRTGIGISMGLRHSGKVTNSFGPTPILTDTLKRVCKYSHQA